MNNIVEVKLDYSKDSFYFRADGIKLNNRLTVVVDTDRGLQFGKIINVIEDTKQFDDVILGDVVRISTKKDYYNHLDNIKSAEEALVICKEKVIDNKLNMSVIDACYSLDKSQLLFRFIANERVDFRNLAKELGSIFHSRIELRQIGIRDKVKEVGDRTLWKVVVLYKLFKKF